MLRKKLILILAALVFGFSATAGAAIPVRQAVYQYAQRGDVQALKKLKAAGHNIDAVDGSGKSVLCSAVASRNVKAYNALIRAGADANHRCMDDIPEAQKKSLCSQSAAVGSSVCPNNSTSNAARSSRAAARGAASEGFWTSPAVLATAGGVAVVGGVAAIAAGGGGGGGGSKSSCPGNCNGHGTCNKETNTCTCDEGWKGDDCSQKVTCPNNCSGYGTCNEKTGTCTCDDDHIGEDCSIEVTCPNNCSGQGTCNRDTKTCKCYPGFDGDDCSEAQPCDKNCSGHGTCEYTGKGEGRRMACTCERGYTGDSCDAYACDGVDCGPNGECTITKEGEVTPYCVCNKGYTGDHCTIKDLCYDARCGKHGSCNIATGFCICEEGFSSSDSRKKDCDVASDFIVEDVTQQESDDERIYGDKVVNGVYTLPFTDGAGNPIFAVEDEEGANVIWNGKNYTVKQIATVGSEIVNGETETINVTGDSTAIAVGLWANGVGKGALSDSGGTVSLKYASKAKNIGSATEEKDEEGKTRVDEDGNPVITVIGGTINAIESSNADNGVIAMKSSSAAEILNSGIINLTAKSPNVSIAMDASRISANVPNRGANVINDGNINIKALDRALNVWGIYAPDRSIVNNATGTIDIALGNSNEGFDISMYPFTLDRNIARGMTGKVAVNKGKIYAHAYNDPESGLLFGASELRIIEASAGGYAVNDTNGFIKLDLTNLLYNIYVLYPTADASTSTGTTAINNGTIKVTGRLENNPSIAKHVYIIGSGASKATLKNEGKITLGSADNPINVSSGGILNIIDGAKGTAENNNAVTMYLHTGATSNNATNLSSSVVVMSDDSAVAENNGVITAVVSGEFKEGSSFNAMNVKGSAKVKQTNNGIINVISSSSGLDLHAMRSGGDMDNGKDGIIYLTSNGGFKSNLNGFAAAGDESSANNAGRIVLTHNGGSGNMTAAGGVNEGSIYIRALDMTAETELVDENSTEWEDLLTLIDLNATSINRTRLNSYIGVSTRTGGEVGNSGNGSIDIELTGSSRGVTYAAFYRGSENEILSNPINILANDLTDDSPASLLLNGIAFERYYEPETTQGTLSYTNNAFISAAGQKSSATYINGMTGVDQSITNDGVLRIDVDLGKSERHQIVGMRTHDTRYGQALYTTWTNNENKVGSAFNPHGNVPLGIYQGAGIGYEKGGLEEYGHVEYTAINNNTIQINVYGGYRNILNTDTQVTYRTGVDDRYPYGIKYPDSFLKNNEIGTSTENIEVISSNNFLDRNVETETVLKPLSIKDYRYGAVREFYPDVIGMATNSVAINNGTIDITISGNSDAKAVGMLAYEGGFIKNNGLIRFNGKTENFIPFYAYGTRVTLLEAPTEEKSLPDYEINYATFANSGTVEINGIEENKAQMLLVECHNPEYNPNDPRLDPSSPQYDPDDPELPPKTILVVTTNPATLPTDPVNLTSSTSPNPDGPGPIQTDEIGFYKVSGEDSEWARSVYRWKKESSGEQETWVMEYDADASTTKDAIWVQDYYSSDPVVESGSTSGSSGSSIPGGTSISSLSSETSLSDLSESVASSSSIASTPALMISQNIKFISEDGGSFSASGYHLLGDVTAGASIVQKGNEDVYIANGKGSGAFVGDGDYSDMTVVSATPLFDASYALNANNAKGIDIVMTRKPFTEVVENNNLAQFLEKNYVAGNNEEFFNKLKSFESLNTLSSGLKDLTGEQMLTRFNFEDISMMRELNFDMNEKLFHNQSQQFALSGSVNPVAFKGDLGSNSKYSLYNRRMGDFSMGLAVAFTNIYSDNSHSKDTRKDSVYQLVAPIGYKTHGFNLISSARMGYARGNYTRVGFEDKSYKGTLEKRVFGLTNEARYPLNVGEWTVEPTAEFNVLGYTQRGSEDVKEYSLNVKSQSTYSVEAGVGLYFSKEEQLSKDSSLKLNMGVAAYHEFADPYKVNVGMNGMDGHFTLRDENRSNNRGVVRSGFDYRTGPYTFYGSMTGYVDRELRANAKTGLKWNF